MNHALSVSCFQSFTAVYVSMQYEKTKKKTLRHFNRRCMSQLKNDICFLAYDWFTNLRIEIGKRIKNQAIFHFNWTYRQNPLIFLLNWKENN